MIPTTAPNRVFNLCCNVTSQLIIVTESLYIKFNGIKQTADENIFPIISMIHF